MARKKMDEQEVGAEEVDDKFSKEQLNQGGLEGLNDGDDAPEVEAEVEVNPDPEPEQKTGDDGEADPSAEEIVAEKQAALDVKIAEVREAKGSVEKLAKELVDLQGRLKFEVTIVKTLSREIDSAIAMATGEKTGKRGPRSLKTYPEDTVYVCTAVHSALGNAFAVQAVSPDGDVLGVVKRSISNLEVVFNEAVLGQIGIEKDALVNHYLDSTHAVEIDESKVGNGLTPFSVGSGHWGFMDEDGAVVITPKYDSIVDGFNENGFAVGEGRRRRGFQRGPLYAVDLDGQHVEVLKSSIKEDDTVPTEWEAEAIAAATETSTEKEE